MKQFFYHDGKQQIGPVDFEQLRTSNIKKDTPIWHDGLENWTTAGKIDELSGIFLKTPPPYFENNQAPPDYVIGSENDFIEEKEFNYKKLALFTIPIIIIIWIIFHFWNLSNNNSLNEQKIEETIIQKNDNIEETLNSVKAEVQKITRQKEIEKNQEIDKQKNIRINWPNYIQISNPSARANFFGVLEKVSFTIVNKSDYNLEEVTINVLIIKDNGQLHGMKEIIKNNIPANGYLDVSEYINTERGSKAKFDIIGVVSHNLGLCYHVDVEGNVLPFENDPYQCN